MPLPKATGAGYASLAQAGISGAVALFSKPDTSSVYTRSYQQTIQRESSRDRQHQGELSLAAARARGVRQRTTLGLNQVQAEAMVRANAAAAGMKGGNVEDSIEQTKSNEAFRLADQKVAENTEIEQALSEVYSGSQASKVPVDDYDTSLMGSLMSGIAGVGPSFLKDLGLAMEENTVITPEQSVAKTEYKVDHYDPSRE